MEPHLANADDPPLPEAEETLQATVGSDVSEAPRGLVKRRINRPEEPLTPP